MVFYLGIKKLLALEPLKKLLPLDLFLPIAYDKYQVDDSVEVIRHFQPRNLIALAVIEPICFPVQYWTDKHHISDTGKLILYYALEKRGAFNKSAILF